MRGGSLAAFLLLTTLGCGQSRPAKAPGRYTEAMRFGGLNRTYVLRVPRAYDGARKLPLVVLLHGWTGSADTAELATGFGRKAEDEGFILVAPDGLGRPQGWNAGFLDLSGNEHPDDAGMVGALIDQISREVGVDEDRIYVAGHSNGAMLTYLVGSRFANRLAAIGVVAGTIGLTGDRGRSKTVPEPVAPCSAMIIHGKADGMVGYDRSSTALITGVSAPESARWWAQHDGCPATPSRIDLTPNVYEDKYVGGRNGTEVDFVTIKNGLHDWPGGLTPHGPERTSGIRAVDLLWDFFKSHPKIR